MRNKIIALVATLGIITLAGCSKQANSQPTSNSTPTSTSATVSETSGATSTDSGATSTDSEATFATGEDTAETGGATSETSGATSDTGEGTSETSVATSETSGSTSVESVDTAESEGTTSSEVGDVAEELDPSSFVIFQANPSDDPIKQFGDIAVKIGVDRLSFLYNDLDELITRIPITVENHSDEPNGLAVDSVTLLYNNEPLALSAPLFGESEDIYQAVEPNEEHEYAIYALCKGKGIYTVKVSHADSTLTYSFIID